MTANKNSDFVYQFERPSYQSITGKLNLSLSCSNRVGLDYIQSVAEPMLIGVGFGETLAITTPEVTQCHSACNGCTKPFSAFFCSACAAGFATINGRCEAISRAEPPNGFVDYTTHDFSAPVGAIVVNPTSPSPNNPTSESEGSSMIWLWIVMIIAVIGAIAFAIYYYLGKKKLKEAAKKGDNKTTMMTEADELNSKSPTNKKKKGIIVSQDEELKDPTSFKFVSKGELDNHLKALSTPQQDKAQKMEAMRIGKRKNPSTLANKKKMRKPMEQKIKKKNADKKNPLNFGFKSQKSIQNLNQAEGDSKIDLPGK